MKIGEGVSNVGGGESGLAQGLGEGCWALVGVRVCISDGGKIGGGQTRRRGEFLEFRIVLNSARMIKLCF